MCPPLAPKTSSALCNECLMVNINVVSPFLHTISANMMRGVVDTSGYNQAEFSLQNEDFPALPGVSQQQQLMQSQLGVGGSSCQSNFPESQLMSVGQSSFGGQLPDGSFNCQLLHVIFHCFSSFDSSHIGGLFHNKRDQRERQSNENQHNKR
jgi:hypothetical protein